MSFRSPLLAIPILALCLVGSPLEPQARRDGSVSEEIDVRLVTLDVYVTDRRGRPVGGLGLEDFEVTEDSVPVEVVDFRSVLGADSASGVGALPSAESPLTVVLYFDESLLAPTDIERLKAPLTRFVREEVPAGSGLVLARFDGSLDVPVAYTESADLLTSALEGLRSDEGGLRNALEADRALETIGLQNEIEQVVANRGGVVDIPLGGTCETGWFDAEAAARAFAAEASDRFERSVENLARFVSGLSGIPGRKSLIYISGGLQMQPGSEVFYSLADQCADRQSEVAALVQEYQQVSTLNVLAAHANANRVTIYPLDGVGVREADGGRQTLLTQANLRDSLSLLGRETGGEAILNTREPTEALGDVGRDLHNYYEITYRPERRFEAPNHLVDVRLRNPGRNEVRYRRTVRPKTTEERLAERLMSTLLLEAEENPLGAEVSVGAAQPGSTSRSVRVPIRVRVPRSGLLLLEGESAPPDGLRLFLVARDDANRGSELREYLVGPEDMESAGDDLEYVIEMELQRGNYRIAVGIRDERAEQASYLRTEADLREAPDPEEEPGAGG